MDKIWRVYMYQFPNGKRYIGATSKTLAQRQGVGFKRYKLCKTLWGAIEQYGVSNIEQTILFEGAISDEEASELERKYIALYNSADPEHGYNDGTGGEGLSPKALSDERKSILANQMVVLGKGNKGRIVSEETRKKQRAAKLGKKRGPMSEETKAKISKSNSRANMNEETHIRRSLSKQKKVIAIEKQTGEQIVFDCVEKAAEYFEVQSSAVSRWIAGTRKPKNNYDFQFYNPPTTTE